MELSKIEENPLRFRRNISSIRSTEVLTKSKITKTEVVGDSGAVAVGQMKRGRVNPSVECRGVVEEELPEEEGTAVAAEIVVASPSSSSSERKGEGGGERRQGMTS